MQARQFEIWKQEHLNNLTDWDAASRQMNKQSKPKKAKLKSVTRPAGIHCKAMRNVLDSLGSVARRESSLSFFEDSRCRSCAVSVAGLLRFGVQLGTHLSKALVDLTRASNCIETPL